MERDLEGRVAIVTGAATGIGYAAARRLARAGARAVIADVDEAAAQQAAESLRHEGLHAMAAQADVADEASVHAMAAAVHDAWGPADILVNNAGITGGTRSVINMDVAVWDQVMGVNLRGIMLCCRAFLPGMLERGKGRIVNVASIAGKEGNPNMTSYSASKAGVIGFTKALAKEVARQGVLVNAISPAVIQTQILDQLTPENVAYMVERIPLGRVGEPDEVAALIHWLSGDNCTFTTGQCVDISGGRATY